MAGSSLLVNAVNLNRKEIKMILKLEDKPYNLNEECPECGSMNTDNPMYVNLGAPNAHCRDCGHEWVISPELRLELTEQPEIRINLTNPMNLFEAVYDGEKIFEIHVSFN